MDEKLRLYIEKTCENLVLAISNCDIEHKKEGSISGKGKWIGCQNNNYQIIYFSDKKTVVIESYPDREYLRFSYGDKVEINYRSKNNGTILQQLTKSINIIISEYKDLLKYENTISDFITRAINKPKIKPYSSHRVSINKILLKQNRYMINALKSISIISKNYIIQGNMAMKIYYSNENAKVYENSTMICECDINNDIITWYKDGCNTKDIIYIDNFLIKFSSEFK